MSDTLTMSIPTCRMYVQLQIDQLKKYYNRIGYTVVQTSIHDQSEGGRVTSIGGCVVAVSEDGFSKSYSFTVPTSVTGSMSIDQMQWGHFNLIYSDFASEGLSF